MKKAAQCTEARYPGQSNRRGNPSGNPGWRANDRPVRPALHRPALLLLLATLCGPAAAAPQWLIGIGGGASLPGIPLYAGPALAFQTSVAPWRQVAFELRADQSFHRIPLSSGGTISASISSVGLGLQYRLDLGTAVPYGSVVVTGERFAPSGFDVQYDLGGAVAVGVIVPFWTNAYAGLEARYGFTFSSTAFPVGRGFLLCVGLRFGGP